MAKKRRQPRPPAPPLTVAQVLEWADAHHARTGDWPRITTAPDSSLPLGENWRRIDNALRYGLRGLPGGSSLGLLMPSESEAPFKPFLWGVESGDKLTPDKLRELAKAQ